MNQPAQAIDGSSPPVVGRLAPSPTGGLHIGHARTFLAAWLSARYLGGRLILRIEDIDVARVRPESLQTALDDLAWLGLHWDEGPYIQSQRLAGYAAILDRLKAAELVYPCTCTRAEITRAASAPHLEDEKPSYPGTCSRRTVADAARFSSQTFAWRFRVPPGPVSWLDLYKGPQSLDPSHLGGDFIVARQSVGPAYQLAVVTDDSHMGVTQVVRGDDLIPSTPRQILLYQALGLHPPAFAHIPLALGPDGRRLAKRDGSIKLQTLREKNVDPAPLLKTLASSLGLGQAKPGDWLSAFRLENIPPTPYQLTADSLESLFATQP